MSSPTTSRFLVELRRDVDRMRADYSAACKAVKKERAALAELELRTAALAEALTIAQAVGESIQRKAHEHVAGLVTRCLEAVFDDPYTFVIRFEKKRNRTEARPVFLRGDDEVDPLTAAGGGVVDVAAFALRLAVLLLKHPKPRRLVVMDEPMKMLSADYVPRVAQLLQALSSELGFQFLIVTHNESLAIGKVIRIKGH